MLEISDVSYHAWLVISIFKIFLKKKKNKPIIYSSSGCFQDQLPALTKVSCLWHLYFSPGAGNGPEGLVPVG
jgi:hypothetical protein